MTLFAVVLHLQISEYLKKYTHAIELATKGHNTVYKK